MSRNKARSRTAPVPAPKVAERSRPSGGSRMGLRIVAIAAAIALVAAAIAYVAYRGSGRARPDAPLPSAAAPETPAAQFVGSSVCADCHRKEHTAWRGSHHDRAMQVADEKTVLGNFDNATFRYGRTTSSFFRRDGRFVVNTDGPDGRLAEYEIKYTFGVAPLQQYLIELPGGRLQALGIAWDSRPKADGGGRWFHLYPGRSVKAGDPLHWTGIDQNWNYQCAECHSTNLRKNFDAATGAYKTAWAELSVGCEACHGPGSNHVAWAKALGAAKGGSGGDKGLAIALDARKGVAWTPVAATGNAQRSAARASSREVDMCARCHGRAGRITDDYVHGRSPLDTHRPAGLDEPLFWTDGQMRDEVYNWAPFVQSRMYAKGVTCSDCHDPHTQKLRAGGNAVCAQCHQPAKFDDPQHTHHASGTPAAACTACHMPTTTYMVIDPRHDHSMRIPRPDLSVKLGVPNACNRCHVRQSARWAADAVARWRGGTPVGHQNFAEAYQAGATGAPGGRDALQAIADDKNQPAIVRAGAIERLGRWLTPSTLAPLTRGLNDPDPLVRSAAVQALAAADPATRQRYLPRMLDDPVRVVRIDAARALTGPAEAGLAPRERLAFDRALAEYVAAQTYNADRPEAHLNLGNVYRERNRADDAIAEYRKALELDPTFVAGYANLADLLRARGAEDEAASTLRQGLARNPSAAPLRHALGLTLVRQRRPAEALAELAAAARLDPGNARYAYVLAVALSDTGKPRESLRALEAALARNPYDRDLVSGMAFYSDKAGDRATAGKYAKLLRELEPESAEAASLAARILERRSP